MYTISGLAKKFQLSRSTLLYYDRIGLLRPSGRSQSAYRQYGEREAHRLGQICTYRKAGLPLAEIKQVLDGPSGSLANVLEKRLDEINEQVQQLRQQQTLIVELLKNKRLLARVGVMNKVTWVSLLEASGFTEPDMQRWHVEFERLAPEKHEKFLQFLCIPEEEIKSIRSWARAGMEDSAA